MNRLSFAVVVAVFLLPATSHGQERFATMTADKIRGFEIEVMEKVADLSLTPPRVNTNALPDCGYDKLDYGMTIGIERTPGGRPWLFFDQSIDMFD